MTPELAHWLTIGIKLLIAYYIGVGLFVAAVILAMVFIILFSKA